MVLEDEKIGEIIDQQDNNAVVTLSINSGTDIEIFQLNGQTIKIMENKKAVLEIKTSNVTYKLPAAQINIDNILAQIGNQVELKDITINVQVSSPPSDTVRMIEDIASKNSYQVVIEPLEFKIICTSGNRSMEISEFNGYVERMIALPDDIDPEKITTGIVLNPDGTVTHVPTLIMVVDGKNYVKINSLTNSTYSAIWNPRSFDDVAFHWAKNDINDMGSRLIIDGVGEGNFEPDRDITRAEFTAIIIKALGLMRTGTGKSAFDDTAKDAWYYDAVSIACQYGIISGYGNGTFKAMDKITREQSISMIARAMEITGLKAELEDSEADKLLMVFGDSEQAASWSKENIASCIKTEIISGRSEKVLAPVDNITRAEAAVMVRRLLQKSKLI
ncbi:MAG: S-layer homology domain-containing protein, partial [Syntrophomonas sp.]